jgi:hypothetical protein
LNRWAESDAMTGTSGAVGRKQPLLSESDLAALLN